MQMERETWRENGLAPPMPGTDAEKHWAEVDKAVPYTKVRSQVGRAVTGMYGLTFRAMNPHHTACMKADHCVLCRLGAKAHSPCCPSNIWKARVSSFSNATSVDHPDLPLEGRPLHGVCGLKVSRKLLTCDSVMSFAG